MNEIDREAIVRVKQQLSADFEPKPWIYWSDLLLSAAVGWGSLAISLRVDSVWTAAGCLFVSTIALFRLLAFTHELEHQLDALPYFRAVWHVLSGMPFCLPHFVYRGVHRIHHSTRYYGTPEDPEYIPYVGQGSFREPVVFLLLPLLFPAMVATRYLILSPLSLFSKQLRTWVVTKASAFAMKLDYTRALPTGTDWIAWRVEEPTTCVFVWSVVGAVCFGVLDSAVLLHWYIVYAGFMILNGFRGLAAAHRYESKGAVLSFSDHIYDSINLESHSLWNKLVGPLNLTYHATHHIYPSLPYYALPKAHELLMAESRRAEQPLAFYVAGQWSDLPSSIARLSRLTLKNREKARNTMASEPVT